MIVRRGYPLFLLTSDDPKGDVGGVFRVMWVVFSDVFFFIFTKSKSPALYFQGPENHSCAAGIMKLAVPDSGGLEMKEPLAVLFRPVTLLLLLLLIGVPPWVSQPCQPAISQQG